LVGLPALALAFAAAVCALLVMASGASPIQVFGLMVKGSLGSQFAALETLTRATPLIFTGLAASVAFRAKLWNIGAEAQLYMGAVMTVVLGTGILPLPWPLLWPLLMGSAVIGGALVLSVPTFLKTRFGVDEVVTTLLLNFIVLLFVSMLLEGWLKDPSGLGWPQSKKVLADAQLPKIIKGKRLHVGFLFAVLAALVVWIIDRRAALGYEMRAVGHNAKAAQFAGIPVNTVLAKTALLSGGLAGLAGWSEVAGLKGNLTLDLSPGFGYSGIVVAMLALLHPMGVIAAAIFVAAVFVGADAMSRTAGVPSYIANVMVALSLLSMVTAIMFTRYRLRRG
jgi:simple sugar transport system permease protein